MFDRSNTLGVGQNFVLDNEKSDGEISEIILGNGNQCNVQVFYKKSGLRNFLKFTWKTPVPESFF